MYSLQNTHFKVDIRIMYDLRFAEILVILNQNL